MALSALILLLCLIEAGWLVLPLIKDNYQQNKQLNQQKENLLKCLSEGQSIQENKKNLKKIEAKKYILEQSWLKSGQELKFITDLEKIAKANQLQQKLDFDNTQFKLLGKKIKIIPVKLTLNGKLNNFMDYLTQIEALDYYINFNNIKIKLANTGVNSAHQIRTDGTKNIQQDRLTIFLDGYSYWE